MGSWDNSTYFRLSDIQSFSDALEKFFKPHGYVPKPTDDGFDLEALFDVNVCDDVLEASDLVVFGHVMNEHWIKFRCYPHYLMCADVDGTSFFEQLAMELRCPMFHVNIRPSCTGSPTGSPSSIAVPGSTSTPSGRVTLKRTLPRGTCSPFMDALKVTLSTSETVFNTRIALPSAGAFGTR